MAISQKASAGTLGGGIQQWRSRSLFDAMRSVGFDPSVSGDEWALVATDLHASYSSGVALADSFDTRIRDELLNLADHPPAACLVLGDVLTGYVGSYAAPVDTVDGALEAAAADASMDWFDALATTYLILGNHDTGPLESPLGAYLAANLADHFGDLHHALTIGGVRFILLSTTHDAALDATARAYLTAQLETLTAGQECVIATHQPGGGRAADGRCLRDIEASVPSGLENPLWQIAGHNHRFIQSFAYIVGNTTMAQWEIGTGQGSWSTVDDDTNPALGAIACRGGEVVARFAWDGKVHEWYVAPDFSRASPIAVPSQFDGLAGETILTSYVEGDYDRTGRLNTASLSTYRIAGSWLAYCLDITANFPMPATATKFFIIITAAPDAGVATGSIRLSTDGSTWEDVTPIPDPTANLSAMILDIPVAMQGEDFLHVEITSSFGPHIGAWGFLS